MNKRTSRHIGKPFATLGAKFAACALSASLYSLGMLGGSVALTETAYAQGDCTGGHFNCVTYINKKWQGINDPSVRTSVQISDFTFTQPISGYPVTSNNTVRRATQTLHIRVNFGGGNPSSVNISTTPTGNLVWDATHQGFKINPRAGGTNTEHLVLKFQMGTSETGCTSNARQGGASFSGSTPAAGSSKQYAIQVCMQAVIISQPPGNIVLPAVDAFNITFDGVGVGTIAISGSPQSIIIPPAPPAPKTCDSVNGTTRTLVLDKIAVDELNNNAKRNPKNDLFNLLNCPANVKLKLTLEDVNKTTSNDDYLVNSLTDTTASMGAGIQLIFGNETTPKRMKASWEIRGANTANATNPINYSARYHHIAGSNLRPGKISSAAKLTIEYP